MKYEFSDKEVFFLKDALIWSINRKDIKLPYGRKKEYRNVLDKINKIQFPISCGVEQ